MVLVIAAATKTRDGACAQAGKGFLGSWMDSLEARALASEVKRLDAAFVRKDWAKVEEVAVFTGRPEVGRRAVDYLAYARVWKGVSRAGCEARLPVALHALGVAEGHGRRADVAEIARKGEIAVSSTALQLLRARGEWALLRSVAENAANPFEYGAGRGAIDALAKEGQWEEVKAIVERAGRGHFSVKCAEYAVGVLARSGKASVLEGVPEMMRNACGGRLREGEGAVDARRQLALAVADYVDGVLAENAGK